MIHLGAFVKYQLASFKKTIGIYYAILLAILLLLGGPSVTTAATEVFVFVLGLNIFTQSFLFAQANNISRKTFYVGTIIALICLAAIFALLDSIVSFTGIVAKLGMYSQIYPPSIGMNLLWSFVFFAFLGSLGWMINMIYYRSNTSAKIVVSLAPVFIIWIIVFLNNWTDGKLWASIGSFLASAFGFTSKVPNPLPAVVGFSVLTLFVWLINRLLMYRMPTKV